MTTQTTPQFLLERFVARATDPVTCQLTSAMPSGRDFLASYVNNLGEELLFVQRLGVPSGELYHSDISQHAARVDGGVAVDVVTSLDEKFFLFDSWVRSERVRESR